jgi:hypothetical protein
MAGSPSPSHRTIPPPWALIVAACGLLWAPASALGQEGSVDREPPSAGHRVYARVLAGSLSLEMREVEGATYRGTLPSGREVVGHGPRVLLEDVRVTRLLFRSAGEALGYLLHLAQPRRSPVVADARGRQLVLLRGPRLADPVEAGRILQAAWEGEVLGAPDAAASAFLVASPPELEGATGAVEFDSVTLLGEPGGPGYDLMLERLRAARRLSREEEGEQVRRVRFVSTNHFTFATAVSYSEVLVTRQGAMATVGPSSRRCRVLVEYARDLVAELAPPPRNGPRPDLPIDHLQAMLEVVLEGQRSE